MRVRACSDASLGNVAEWGGNPSEGVQSENQKEPSAHRRQQNVALDSAIVTAPSETYEMPVARPAYCANQQARKSVGSPYSMITARMQGLRASSQPNKPAESNRTRRTTGLEGVEGQGNRGC